jgi:AraC-like DNA-binding protein
MSRRHKLVVGGAALVVAVVAGGAIGATKLTPRQESQAVIDDAAKQLGVAPSELTNALKQALKNRVDEAVKEGRLTKEMGEAMKRRIDAGEVPLFGLGPRFHREHDFFFHAKLEAAAEYLGMSETQLRDALSGGKTLAQVARDRDKSVDGLVDAMLADAKQKVEDDVEAGRLTEAEKDDLLAGLKERITNLVNGRFPRPPGPRFHRHGGLIFPAEPRPSF